MSTSAVRLASIMLAAALIASGGWVASVWAQMEAAGGGSTVIHSGNTDIIFESVGTYGLPMARYQAFDHFASVHPEIIKALARNPRLIRDQEFVSHHPALADFLRGHPDIASDFAQNPGNYVVMPPAVEASLKRHPIE